MKKPVVAIIAVVAAALLALCCVGGAAVMLLGRNAGGPGSVFSPSTEGKRRAILAWKDQAEQWHIGYDQWRSDARHDEIPADMPPVADRLQKQGAKSIAYLSRADVTDPPSMALFYGRGGGWLILGDSAGLEEFLIAEGIYKKPAP